MSNTYSQIHLHIVFAVKNRQSLITPILKDELYKFITGTIQNRGHKLCIINGMPDHVHILIGMRPTEAISTLVNQIKSCSTKWINGRRLVRGKFEWQEGFGVFSYSRSHLDNVIKYIKNQEKHHSKKSFIEEYVDMLQKFEIAFDERYIFKPI
ncbi:IS200/IS605 family transposase [Chitinophaga vietnamensis]|uniref:IS200/IS605 family transposase n=1 Tax=Chitinophaga vietnamensis TaxID=2593957 RepID=UPI001177C667|nr:IS200/IS605 family transposase [Chitinophaga vietnamensis]